MNSNLIFLYVISAISAITILRILLQRAEGTRGWAYVNGVILLAALLGMVLVPRVAGYGVAVLWFVAVLLPTVGMRLVQHLSAAQKFARARFIARGIALLHPMDGWWALPLVYEALAHGQAGRFDDAYALLERVAQSGRDKAAILQLYRMQQRWDEVIAWLEQHPEVEAEPAYAMLKARALGELGRLDDMLELYNCQIAATARGHRDQLAIVWLVITALCGRRDTVTRICDHLLPQLPESLRQFWKATATAAAGSPDAQEQFCMLRDDKDQLVNQAVLYRLKCPIASVALRSESEQILAALEREVEEALTFGDVALGQRMRAAVTLALMVATAVVFGLQIPGGTTDWMNLIRLGALNSELVARGEWYRLLTAVFLHFGPLHLGFNMLALYVIGPYVEFRIGKLRYLLLYLLTGAGSMAIVLLRLTLQETRGMDIVVGASGSIMGLIGATAALLLHGWRTTHSFVARERLIAVGVIIGLQTVFDILIPEVSLTAHLSGLVIGFGMTYCFVCRHVMAECDVETAPSHDDQ